MRYAPFSAAGVLAPPDISTQRQATGELTEDHNAGLCKVAQQSCGASGRRKRWDNFSAVKEKAAKRAAAPRSTGPQAVSAWKMVRKRVADVDA